MEPKIGMNEQQIGKRPRVKVSDKFFKVLNAGREALHQALGDDWWEWE